MLRIGASSGVLAFGSMSLPAFAAGGPFKIALSNAYNGNAWRRQHSEAFERAAKEMVKRKIFSEFSSVHGSDNSVPAQLAAIGDMILQGNRGIMVNCSSGSQVNGVIEQAADAGIKVVSYDAYASSDRSHNLGFDFAGWGRNNAEFVEKHLGGEGKATGNVLIVNLSLGATAGKLIREEYQSSSIAIPRSRSWPRSRVRRRDQSRSATSPRSCLACPRSTPFWVPAAMTPSGSSKACWPRVIQ